MKNENDFERFDFSAPGDYKPMYLIEIKHRPEDEWKIHLSEKKKSKVRLEINELRNHFKTMGHKSPKIRVTKYLRIARWKD